MAAIQPARLKMQIEWLMEVFHQPDSFGRRADEILSLYANRTQRPGHAEAGSRLLPAYHTPRPVLLQIFHAARPLANDDPNAALACVDALWLTPVMETRLLAAQLLGVMPTEDSLAESTLERIIQWCYELEDDSLRKQIVQTSLNRLAAENPRPALKRIASLIEVKRTRETKFALLLLLALVENPEFQNLPAAFNLAAPILRSPDPLCKPQLLDLMQALVQRSPQESAYFFEQASLASANPETRWIVRQVSPSLPKELAERLRRTIR
jgi:hypothetical protein